MTATLTTSVLTWLRGAYPNGVPDEDASALHSVLHERLGNAKAHDVLRNLLADGLLSPAAASALLPDDEAMRSVSAKLVLGGWPLAGEVDDEEDSPPKEGTALGRIVAWLREGYPGGVPDHDYIPLLALLERRLTRSEVKKVAKALRRADVSPAGPADIAAAIQDLTQAQVLDGDLRRVREQLAKKGWPVEFPDPDLP